MPRRDEAVAEVIISYPPLFAMSCLLRRQRDAANPGSRLANREPLAYPRLSHRYESIDIE